MSNVQGSPSNVTINGESYRMQPLSDKDIGEVNNFIRKGMLTVARQSLKGEEDQEVRDEVLRVALKEAMRVDWLQNPRILTSESLLFMFWVGLRDLNPELTFEKLGADLLADPDALEECMNTFMLIQAGNFLKARTPQDKSNEKENQ